ncbi:hypothetical protein MPLA_770055 [Mesorhizobium sp. ORS 3359]|nr:hypothetical protein MPLA_770055 [Mesorhizobium sp. ORS 3359]
MTRWIIPLFAQVHVTVTASRQRDRHVEIRQEPSKSFRGRLTGARPNAASTRGPPKRAGDFPTL